MAIEKTINIKVNSSDAEKKLKGLDKQVKTTSKTATQTGKGLSGAFSGMGAAIKGVIPSLAALKTALISTGIGAIVVAFGAFVSILKKANDLGADFSKGLSTLRAVTGNTADELSVLNEQAKELGATTQFTAIEVVGLQTELAKLGFTIKDIKNSTPAILDLAASLEIDLASAAEFAGSVVRSFGLTTEDTQRVVDVMAKSTSSSALNFDALRESLKVVAPVARATGVSIEQTAAYLGVLANNGLKGSVAGTGLSKSFIELNKKGIDINDAFEKVTNSSNGLGTAIELVGVVGAKSFLSLAEGTKDIEDLKVAFEDAEGAAQAMAEIRLDNLEGDTTKLSSAWDGFLLNIEDGEGILNKLSRGAIQTLTKTIGRLTGAIELAGFALDYYFGNSASVAEQEAGLSKRAANLGLFVGTMQQKFAAFKLFLSDIPIIGRSIDTDKAKESLTEAIMMVDFANKKLQQISNLEEQGAKKGTFWQEWKKSQIIKLEEELTKGLEELSEEKSEKRRQETEDEIAAREKAEKELADIIKKTNKSAEDLEDETQLEKAQRKRERALKELEDVKLNETKKAEAKIAINQYYDSIEAEAKIKDDEAEVERNNRIIAEAKRVSDEKIKLEAKKTAAKQKAVNDAIALAGAESKIGKALLILKQGLALKEMIMEAKKTLAFSSIAVAKSTVAVAEGTAQTAKVGFPQNIPLLIGYAAQAAGIISAISSATGKAKSAASSLGGGGGSISTPSAPPAPPAFNVVGASGSSQLADAIGGQSQQPIQTYVVSNDVTTAQSLQNNIVEGATIG